MTESHSASVRPATATDVPMIEAVVDEAFSPYVARIGVRPVPMDADYAALVESGLVWVAARGERAVCGAIVLVPEDDHLLLDTIAVSNDVRGTGVGSALMAFAEERARILGLPAVHLYTNQLMWENLDYYPKLGYAEVARATFNDVYHRVLFTKSVA